MHYAGIDLHRNTLVVGIENESGPVGKPKQLACRDEEAIYQHFEKLRPFRAVVEASTSYRWLYDLLSPLGEVILAHPRRLKAIVDGRAKTDKLDAALLAKLLRVDLIPRAYVPPQSYALLREFTRGRARLSRHLGEAKRELQTLLYQRNVHVPVKTAFCKSWIRFVSRQDFGVMGNEVRDEIFQRMAHFQKKLTEMDHALGALAPAYPEVECLMPIRGIALYTALLIIGEIGEPWRFQNGKQVGAYAGLTAQVNQSGGHCYYGNITKQGSKWLRWGLGQVAMKVLPGDPELKRFYTRIRKRSNWSVARTAVARKLAGICWHRLMKWHNEQVEA